MSTTRPRPPTPRERWTTDDEIRALREMRKKNPQAYANYRVIILRNLRWWDPEIDVARVRAYVQNRFAWADSKWSRVAPANEKPAKAQGAQKRGWAAEAGRAFTNTVRESFRHLGQPRGDKPA